MFLDFSWVAEPTAWGGLGTLILLEVVLGIDNLVFISILSSRLPEDKRRHAFTIGLSLALIMRLGLLSTVAWLIGLTKPWFSLFGYSFTARDIILLIGGLFLLLKGTMELHERLEGVQPTEEKAVHQAVFWQVITQIVVLDAIFSLDSIITSVGMVKELSIMMLAVIIAVLAMLLASRPLTEFVDRHPTVIILCLGFLLMIGLSLILEGLGYHIPKGYLYAAIGFSIVVEAFNQLALRNRRNRITTRGLRESAARAVLELLGRHKVQWLDSNESPEALLKLVGASKHAFLPVMCRDTDEVLGVVDLRELLWRYQKTGRFSLEASVVPVPMVFEHTGLPDVLDAFRQHPAPMGIVLDEYGSAVGVVTPMDILSAIAGHMGDVAPEPDSFRQPDGSWLLPGRMAVDEGLHTLGIQPEEELSCATMAGLLLERLGHIPAAGESLFFWGHLWTVASMDGLRIDQIRIHPQRSGDITEKSE